MISKAYSTADFNFAAKYQRHLARREKKSPKNKHVHYSIIFNMM